MENIKNTSGVAISIDKRTPWKIIMKILRNIEILMKGYD
jgi:hypothetical protein